ncbi:MAG: hypothetical protein ACX931_16770 [Saccharospirillum sp.]
MVTHYGILPILMALAALGGVAWPWIILGGLAGGAAAYGLAQTQPRYTRLSWQGSQLTLYGDEAEDAFTWQGKGRRSPVSIRFDLTGEAGSYRLVIWRDSVSDASWRALQAAFRIQAPALRQR